MLKLENVTLGHGGTALRRVDALELAKGGRLLVAGPSGGLPRDKGRAMGLLERLGIAGKAASNPHELSRGEAQRAALARAVINRPALILADEPTSSLDDGAAGAALELIVSAADETGAALLVASHDSRIAGAFSQRLDMGGAA
jgi:putative ABC transport system ATP-binding protein